MTTFPDYTTHTTILIPPTRLAQALELFNAAAPAITASPAGTVRMAEQGEHVLKWTELEAAFDGYWEGPNLIDHIKTEIKPPFPIFILWAGETWALIDGKAVKGLFLPPQT